MEVGFGTHRHGVYFDISFAPSSLQAPSLAFGFSFHADRAWRRFVIEVSKFSSQLGSTVLVVQHQLRAVCDSIPLLRLQPSKLCLASLPRHPESCLADSQCPSGQVYLQVAVVAQAKYSQSGRSSYPWYVLASSHQACSHAGKQPQSAIMQS